MLIAAAGVVFLIACSNAASLILARSVRRESELAVRAALGASHGALRRMLLAESLVLCGAGAVLGVLLARPLVAVVARFAARFSVRALEVTVDQSLLWVGVGLALAAAVLLAYVPRLPSPHVPTGFGLAGGGVRIAPGTNRRLRVLATTQIAFSFVLLAGAGMLLASFVALQKANTGYNLRQVLALDLPDAVDRHRTTRRRWRSIKDDDPAHRRAAGVKGVALGNFVPWRDAGTLGPGFQFAAEGYTPASGEENPHARLRVVAPGFFAVLGVPLLAGRDFTDEDRRGSELVVIVTESVARRLFPDGDAMNRKLWWTDPYFGKPQPRRIVGVVRGCRRRERRGRAGAHDLPPGAADAASRDACLCTRRATRTRSCLTVKRIIREMSADQPVERVATLEDVRADVLAPERLNVFVVSGFAGIALLDRRDGRGGSPGALRERAHARVRRAAGDRIVAAATAAWRPVPGRGHRGDRNCRWYRRAAMRSAGWPRRISRA